MKKIKHFELVTLLSGFFMFACLVIFGLIVSGNQAKSSIQLTKSPDLSKKIEVSVDSVSNIQ